MDIRSEDRTGPLRPTVESTQALASTGVTGEHDEPLRRPVPGRLFTWVKYVSWIESLVFAVLLFFWIAPGYGSQTSLFGLLHGLGYVGLCVLIFIALLKHEAPWPLFAATLTPIGPFGTVIGIELIERRGWGVAKSTDPVNKKWLTPPERSGDNRPAEAGEQLPS
jgi:hypothetical protein